MIFTGKENYVTKEAQVYLKVIGNRAENHFNLVDQEAEQFEQLYKSSNALESFKVLHS
jgi:hypothetical protein